MKSKCYSFVLLLITASLLSFQVKANDSSQFISYWKTQMISAHQDDRVQLVESVFQRLLRAWDSSRLEPGLFVVDSDKGPWAASLVDGNILLSSRAVDVCLSFGEQRAPHLLAFILAHELAHQRSDDLWQHRFFRNPDNRQDIQSNQSQNILNNRLNNKSLQDMEHKEAKADFDGLILMSSVGFDPYQIVDKKDFFTEWVESIWHSPCELQNDSTISNACEQAKKRAINTRSQLNTVASQSSLYDLGMQALVAKKYDQARFYFTQYARDFPSRAVMTALGISHLAPAMEMHKQLIHEAVLELPDFYFPLIMEASDGLAKTPEKGIDKVKRSGVDNYKKNQLIKIKRLSEQAVVYFEKAIRLQPDHRSSYLMLATAYLVSHNKYMVRGILQGRYIPEFGQDRASQMLLAITDFIEGKKQQAELDLIKLISSADEKLSDAAFPGELIDYSLSFNAAAIQTFNGEMEKAKKSWQQLAQKARKSSNAYLFRLALAQLQPQLNKNQNALTTNPTVNGLRLGDRKSRDDSSHTINELWIQGEPYHVYNYDSGVQFITGTDGRVLSARQQSSNALLEQKLRMGDPATRVLKTLGLPDRRLHLVSGEYLAYDQYGLALQLENESVNSWFLY